MPGWEGWAHDNNMKSSEARSSTTFRGTKMQKYKMVDYCCLAKFYR